jgi:hypothetical protein
LLLAARVLCSPAAISHRPPLCDSLSVAAALYRLRRPVTLRLLNLQGLYVSPPTPAAAFVVVSDEHGLICSMTSI